MKKFLAIVLCVMLVCMSVPVFAAGEGETYRTLYSGEVTTLNYLITSSANEYAMAANVIDTLVEYDNLGEVKPSLAESWEVSEDGLTWTFKIRSGANWVDHTGAVVAPVTAGDFVAAAKYVLNAQNASSTANIIYDVIAGAEAYYEGTSTPEEGEEAAPVMEWDTVGIKALDEGTLEYTLITPVPYFLSMLTYVCFMPVNEEFLLEKGDGFGLATGPDTILYNGAYYISEMAPQEKRVYTRNAENWDAENVFIDAITMTYNKEASTISPEMYRRGEVDEASIDSTIAAEWLASPETADLIRPIRQSGFYTYFWAFNFDPQFDAAYEPENWKIVVNNENFRKALYYGLDRAKSMACIEPDNPENNIFNTITPPEFVALSGKDYVEFDALAEITALGLDTFNAELAAQYMATAVEELTAAGATFPVKILTPYNPNTTGWAEECQVVEQQLEALFGTDIIDIIVEAGPSTGFLSEVRRSGKYAFMKCNWGPDYADPQTYTEPMTSGNSYNFVENNTEYNDEAGQFVYDAMVAAAIEITDDIEARYTAFAEAEAFIIENAIVIPYGYGTGGYIAARLNPFESQYAPFGISNERFKGQRLLEEPMSTDMYYDAYDAWLEARAALAD